MERETVLYRLSMGKVTLIFLGLYIVSMFFGNIVLYPMFTDFSNGNSLLDSTLNYSPNTAYDLFDNLAEAGRKFYLKFLLIYDVIHPLIVFSFFSSLLLFMLRKAGRSFNKILIFTLFALCVDLCENIFLSISIIRYPIRSDTLIMIANIFTLSKTISVIMYPVITIILFIIMLSAMYKKKKTI